MTNHAPAFDYPQLLVEVTGEFADLTRVSDLSAPVAACPGWEVRHLVGHLGRIHAWATAILRSGRREPFSDGPVQATSPEAAADWYAERAARLCDATVDLDPEEECWNFSGVHQWRGFWPRRQVHETGVHLLDLARAAGGDHVLDPALSGDGVHEVFQVFHPRQAQRGSAVELVRPIRVVATDLGMSWLLVPDPTSGVRLMPRGGPAPAAELDGSAADLLMVLWKRIDAGAFVGAAATETLRLFLASSHTP